MAIGADITDRYIFLKSKTCVPVTLPQISVCHLVWVAVSFKELYFLCVVKDSAILEDKDSRIKLAYLYIM